MRDACAFKQNKMSSVKTVFSVKIYPHPSKRKQGPRVETISSPGYGHDAAAVDKFYSEQGLKMTKVLKGFEIDDNFVEADLTSLFDAKHGRK